MTRFFDNHSHSFFSDDSKMTVEDAILTAANKGLGGIAITDHFDYNVPEGVMLFQFNPEDQQEALVKAAHTLNLPNGFKVLKGIEIGVQPDCVEKMKTLADSYPFDTIVASLHFIDGKDPYHGNYYIPYEYKRGYGHYLETFYECMCLFDNFDILGHFDYIARYSPYEEASILYKDFGDILDQIMRKLIEQGKTFEINTKTYHKFHGNHEPHLDQAILHRWKELGGEFVSFGSDAHETKRIGENFEKFTPILLEAGIRYTVYYENRVAHPVSLI